MMRVGTLFQYRKDPRVIVTVPILIIILTSLVYYLIQRAKELSPEALSSRLLLFVLWNINLLLVLGILFVLLRMGVKLLLERQKGILGSRFRTKLVATYLVTSLFPILLLFFVATDLLRVSIDRWFNMPVRTILRNSEQIANAAQDRAIAQTVLASEEIRDSLAAGEQDRGAVLEHVRRFHDVDLAGIYEKQAIAQMLGNPRVPIHELPELTERFLDETRERGPQRRLDVVPSGKWIRTAIAIDRDAIAVAGTFIPSALSRLIDENVIAHGQFLQLDAQKTSLKATQTSLFLAFTLAILFGAIWMAIYISRRITEPVQALAEGTRTLAGGEYGHRIDLKATDEFGVLIDSFNTMASQLEMQRQALTDSNIELTSVNTRLDDERSYLFTVLESVSSGIVALGDNHEILSINRAASGILQLEGVLEGKRAAAVFVGDLAPVGTFILEIGQRAPRPREVTIIRNGELHYLELSAARLAERRRGGAWVVAIEDSTQLVQAQKLAAWSEAARRIAHEIKNPLTPIQLSAERILKKSRAGDSEVSKAIESGCSTIVSEVAQLKRMVDEFSRFARMPAVHLERSSIHEILEGVAALYREVKPNVRIEVDADPEVRATVDPEQLRRALINLLDNAIEATNEGTIMLSASRRDGSLRIEIADPGRGVPDSDKERLFLPHFSTKGRGTGLGLAIVHRIVNDHDGTISVHDNNPRGTRFVIEIPA